MAGADNFGTWADGMMPPTNMTLLQMVAESNMTIPCSPVPPRSHRRTLQEAGYILPTWVEFFDMYIFWPIIFQLFVTVLFVPMSLIYGKLYSKKGGPFRRFVDNFIGTFEKPQVNYPALVVICYILQLLFSMSSVVIFVNRTYTKEVTDSGRICEIIFSIFFVFHYFLLRMQAGFNPSSPWILGAFVDNLTMIPVLFGRDRYGAAIAREKTWLSLKYLRAYRALLAYQRLEKTVDLKGVSEIKRKLFLSFLRTMALIICYSGTIMVLEILGEFPGWIDDEMSIETNMGNLTFMQMFYWMVTTISTVGYGDFSPTTVPGRIMICGFIVGGIIFFGNETAMLGEISKTDSLGKGRYVKTSHRREHVVVVGSGCNKCSAQMTTFVQEILDAESGLESPDVILLSESPFDQELIDWVSLSLPKKVQKNVIFLNGNAMVKNDLQRCSLLTCHMAFIIPDISVTDCDMEDGQNILRAMEMKRYHRGIKLRLMLLQPESKTRAVTIGIKRERCFAAYELKSNVFVQSLRCKGFMTMVSGLLQTVNPFEINQIQQTIKAIDKEWMDEYLWSLHWSVYGMVIDDEFAGMSFSQAAAQIFEKSGGVVLLLGAQFRGKLMINFDGDIESLMVVICIARHHHELRQFKNTTKDWRLEFIRNRQAKFDSPFSHLEGEARQNARLEDLAGKDHSCQLEKCARQRSEAFKAAYYRKPEPAPLANDAKQQAIQKRKSQVYRAAITEEELLFEEKEAEHFRENPDLVTLLIVGQTKWQQVVAFLKTLRQPWLPKFQPVIVLSPEPPPEELVIAFETAKVAFLTGPLMSVSNLIEAGIREAQSIVVMRGDVCATVSSAADAVFGDHETVLLSSMIEQIMADTTKDQFAIQEFETTTSVHLVEHQSREMKASASGSFSDASSSNFRLDKSFDHSASSLNPGLNKNGVKKGFEAIGHGLHAAAGVMRQLFTKGMDEGEEGLVDAVQGQLIFHPRFAAGQAFTPDFFGGLLGHIYRFPATVEFTEAITMPGRRGQTSFPWQVRLPPEWVGKQFGELVKSWLVANDPKLKGCGSLIILAMYRQKEMAEAPINSSAPSAFRDSGYNVTLPQLNTTLRQEDRLTVLASEAFGKAMADRKLLRGAMSDATEPESKEPSKEPHPEQIEQKQEEPQKQEEALKEEQQKQKL